MMLGHIWERPLAVPEYITGSDSSAAAGAYWLIAAGTAVIGVVIGVV